MDRDSSKISHLIVFIVLMSLTGAGFFLPFAAWGWLGGIFKALLFVVVGVALYWWLFGDSSWSALLNHENEEEDEPRTPPEPSQPQDQSWTGFGQAFDSYRNKTLVLIQQALVAEQVGFYLIRNGRPVFEAGATESGLHTEAFIVGEDALVHQVITEKNTVLKEYLPEHTYSAGFDDTPIQSFLGVPLVVGDECLGLIAAGSRSTQHFGEADGEMLSRYADLLLQVMTLCHRGLHWEMDQEVYRVHLAFEKQLETAHEEGQVLSAFLEQVKRLFPFDRFTLCRRVGQEGEIRFLYGQVDHLEIGTRFPLDGGLNGWLIKRNAPLIIQDIEEGRYIRPRYYAEEDSKHGIHSFLGIPLNGGRESAWGCISLESKNSGQYAVKAKDVLSILAIPLQLALERIQGVQSSPEQTNILEKE